MKKTLFALTFAASLGLAACSNPGDEVVVKTEMGDITQDQFYKEIKKIAGDQLLQQVVMDKILNDKYEVSDKEVQKQYDTYAKQYGDQMAAVLEANGLTEETFKQNIRFNLLQEKAKAEVKVSDKEVKEYYDQASQELHARHILVATQEEAKEIVKELKNGGDFAKIAKEKSTDTASAAEGGDLGWFSVGAMVKEFNDAAYALEPKTISEPVKSDYGYHIIEVLEKRDVKDYGTLEEKKDEITEAIRNQKADWPTIQAKLVKDAKVEVKDKDLKDAFK
ncbi:peptidylprolyl isomerase [Lysinibacillus odysseyi]|uniref:Foldase protein PrsA n=1 Tax=Lysinibacillus odysseyi 34hs-1 = NBRC 100172 TaxID=1220589 RepID=A0A0A3IDS9_9BACI|nr:peptidylprolyl isomerase [Lysinibacillus odysseyi]KGR82864.1 foldase [Lysinibacillus odysseyi 34hs-1 = NBRC 100172]